MGFGFWMNQQKTTGVWKHMDQNDQTVFFNMGMSSFWTQTFQSMIHIYTPLYTYIYVEDFMWGMISMGCSKCGVPQGIYHPVKSQAMSH